MWFVNTVELFDEITVVDVCAFCLTFVRIFCQMQYFQFKTWYNSITKVFIVGLFDSSNKIENNNVSFIKI